MPACAIPRELGRRRTPPRGAVPALRTPPLRLAQAPFKPGPSSPSFLPFYLRAGTRPASRRRAGGDLLPIASLLIASLLLAAGCAHYSTTSGLIGGIRSVAIPVAENDTPEFRIGEDLSERLGDAYRGDGRLRLVDEESADAVLYLRVTDLQDRPFTYTAAEETEQYRFSVHIDMELLRAVDGSSLLELKDLQGWGTYDAGLPDEEGRDPAVEAALDMVVEEIVDRTTAGW